MFISPVNQPVLPNDHLRGTHWQVLRQDQGRSDKKINDLGKMVGRLNQEVESLKYQQPMSPGQIACQYAILTDGINQAFVPLNDHDNQIADLYQREGYNKTTLHARITQIDRKHESARDFLKQAHQKELNLLKEGQEAAAKKINSLEGRIAQLEAQKIPAEEDNMLYYRLDELERKLLATESIVWSDFGSKFSLPSTPRK